MKILVLLVLASFQVTTATSTSQRKVFVVDHVTVVGKTSAIGSSASAAAYEHHGAPVVMAEFAKRCPSVFFTQDRTAAEFVIEPQQGSTSLINAKGDILYISPAKNMGNMAKDICKYISSH